MNYLKEINAFFDEKDLNSLSLSASMLWYVLIQFNNKTGWKEEFTVPTSSILVKSALSESAFLRARKELAEKGYILFEAGRRHQAPTYQMISQVKEAGVVDVEDTEQLEVKDMLVDKPGVSPEALCKRKEVKGKEEGGGARMQPHTFYEENFGVLNPFIAEKITDWCEQLSDELVMESMRIAGQHNKLFFHYCEGILKRWEKAGVKSLVDVERMAKTPSNKKDDRKSVVKRMFEEYRRERHA
ncbi:DnaD domain protein [Halobacillus campisalis]|uniref:DnaD domain protein n=1 Tax=Halobacillus campisalis TaxID=435909 RepID=A0ABW2JZC9_9BACI|nr:DnaD domain protein [Halobacillus campisalis]